MKPKVIVFTKIQQEVLNYIGETCSVTYFEHLNPSNYPDFLLALGEAEGILGYGIKVDKELLDYAPRLKVVSTLSVGYEALNIAELTARRILATNLSDVSNDSIADVIFALILATARRIPELDQFVKKGNWKQKVISEDLFGVDVHHKVLGIIGMGRIGTAIAKRAHHGFDMRILYHNRSRNEEAERMYEAQYCCLDELLKQSDFVCLMTPLTAETENLMGIREFQLMKKTAIFINGSRGTTVNEKDLIFALQNQWILAAGLDVYEKEPVDPHNPLVKMKNVVTVPHIGPATLETLLNMGMLAAKNLVQGLTGQKPQNLINPEVLANLTSRKFRD